MTEVARQMNGRPLHLEVHYHPSVGYWAKIRGRCDDVGVYGHDWDVFCTELGPAIPAALHGPDDEARL